MAALALSQTCHPEGRRAQFELLKARLSAKPSIPAEALIPTAIPELDRLLGGGFPAGIVATLEGETGRWSVAAALAARMTRRSLVAVLDDGGLYPPAFAEAGGRLARGLILPPRHGL